MLKEKWSLNRVMITLTGCIMIMLLLFCTLLGTTFAWLTASISRTSTGNTNLATLKDATSTSSGTYDITTYGAGVDIYITSLDPEPKITNNGTINALARVFYSFSIDDNTNEIATTNHIDSITFNTDFIASDENIPNTYSGYYYYNKVLAPGDSVYFITKIVPKAPIANKTIKLNLNVELVNYNGGPYLIGQQLPWKNTPASWFMTLSADRIVYQEDFESYADGSKGGFTAYGGGIHSVTSESSKSGAKSVKITSDNITDESFSGGANIVKFLTGLEEGYYTISMWIKTDAPKNSMRYRIFNGNLYGEPPSIEFYSAAYTVKRAVITYDCSEDWSLLMLNVPTIIPSGDYQINLTIPTGYNTYVDNVMVIRTPA